MCASPLPVSEVAATSAAVSRPTASHPRSAICVQDSSRRARVTGASALHIECMQMLQIIVHEDPIPSRLLLNHHSTRTAVPAWRYDLSHLVFTGVTGNLGGLPYCNSPFRLSSGWLGIIAMSEPLGSALAGVGGTRSARLKRRLVSKQ
jgi:hypothetical protein